MLDGKYIMSEVTLMPEIEIADEQQKERAERVLQKSEANCLISNSVKSRIVFQPSIKIKNLILKKIKLSFAWNTLAGSQNQSGLKHKNGKQMLGYRHYRNFNLALGQVSSDLRVKLPFILVVNC